MMMNFIRWTKLVRLTMQLRNLYFHRRMNSVMKPQGAPGPESLVTVVTGKGDSLKVIRLYVVLDVAPLSLLATHGAGISLLQSTFAHVFTFPHHGFDLFIQFLYISDINTCKFIVWNSHCCLTW